MLEIVVIIAVVLSFKWLLEFLYFKRPEREYEREQSIAEERNFIARWESSLFQELKHEMTAAELKKWHQENAKKREPEFYEWDTVKIIDPDYFRIGDITLIEGEWHEHNGSEWVMKHKYNNQ